MSQTVQEKEKSQEVKMDKGVPQGAWQRAYNGKSSASQLSGSYLCSLG